MIVEFGLALALMRAAWAQPLPAQQKLDEQIKTKLQAFHGQVSIYAKNLDSGATYSLNGEEPVRTASTIKLAIMTECFAAVNEGKLNLGEKLTLSADEKVPGAGLLHEFSDGDQLPVRDLIDLMIVMSDNTATNMLLDRVGGNAVNARMQQLGFEQMRVMRKIGGSKSASFNPGVTTEGAKPENKKWGIGRSSPYEMAMLMEKLYRGELVSKAASAEMLAILKRQRDRDGIARDMQDVEVANKTGALDHLRSDVGIVYSKRGNIAIAITIDDIPDVNWTPDNPGLLMISGLSELLLDGLANK
ncbi:MAG: serine hydrolase [Acidobacteriaceae bacterium]|nr:serine hydrolase [Acidobacteriaceae bacterium]MBV8571854.1 serine hydrolase [Acidobacteriaceae bacterium]